MRIGATVTTFHIDTAASSLIIEARSTVGPITWEARGLTGRFDAEVTDGTITAPADASGLVTVPLDEMHSGNSVYDAELLKRLNARQFPEASVALTSIVDIGEGTFHAQGEMTLHGVTRLLTGVIKAEIRPDSSLLVTGSEGIDIRDFDIPIPSMLMLKIYPDVRVFLFLQGTPVADD